MTPITPVNTEIQDYLRGVARARTLNDLNRLCDSDWVALAKTELRRREEEAAQRLLMLFSPEALAAIADDTIDMVGEIAGAIFRTKH